MEASRIGINRSYRLNPNFDWKSNTKNHKMVIKENFKNRIKTAGISIYENRKSL
ncbi:hypothetical protein [Bartonella tribocorum]|uniref:hypothetical protein n=1 Tax=Bartonella tribocorum TaxID=85701 RepID=UPI001FDA7C62|nr:hypothetical protein [Bartonella tribocorum]